jgi:hypothetical protein
MCSIQALVTNGILHMGEEGEVVEESLTPERVSFLINLLSANTFFLQSQKGA